MKPNPYPNVKSYVRNEECELPFLQYNNRTELIEFRAMLQEVGLTLMSLPSEEDGGDCVLPKGDTGPAKAVVVEEKKPKDKNPEEAKEDEDDDEKDDDSSDEDDQNRGPKLRRAVTEAREKAIRKLGHGPSNKSEAKQFKSKMNRVKAFTKKQKSAASGCAVQ